MKAAMQGQHIDDAPMKCYPDNTIANKGIDLDVWGG